MGWGLDNKEDKCRFFAYMYYVSRWSLGLDGVVVGGGQMGSWGRCFTDHGGMMGGG